MNLPTRSLARSFLVLGLAATLPPFGSIGLRAADGTVPKDRRAALVAKYDANGDGRLDATEREKMRLALKAERRAKSGGGGPFKIPADFLAKYDANKNGEMENEEWKVAWEAENKILVEKYDADKDKALSKTEKASMMADVKAGKITGIPAFFAGQLAEDDEGSQPDYIATQKALLKFDADADGRASAAELEKIRKSRGSRP